MTTARPDTPANVDADAAVDAADPRSRWPAFALGAICLISALLYVWGIGDSWGNPYYSAAVKSMSQSFENFFFGAFDPAGVVTVDKPPMALWAQVASVMVFGFNKFAVLFPQVVAGVAAVLLLHRTVRRWAGEHAALLAALVMAITPVTVAINRDNNPDTLLVLLVVAAAYALTRSIDSDRSSRATGWLLLAAFLVGCGFLTKMLQAWMVLPAFIAAYLIGRNASWGRRLGDLAAAAAVLVVSSFWWVAATAMWPSPKPYIGGSTDGSAWDLVFGYNGFGRILGGGQGPGGGPPGGVPGGMPPGGALPGGVPGGMPPGGDGGGMPPGGPGRGGGFGGETGVLRMFSEQFGGQISWLLPLCLLILASMLVVAVRRWRASAAVDRRSAAGWALWGGWLVVVALMLSFAQGIVHSYYSTMLAPAVAAIVGAGIVRYWRWYREPEGRAWLLLPTSVVVTAVWAVLLVLRDPSWNVWAAYVAGTLAVLGVGALVIGRWSRRGLATSGLVLGLAAILAVPGVWSASAAFAGQSGGMGGVNPMAGPPSAGFGGSGGIGRGGQPPGGNQPGGLTPQMAQQMPQRMMGAMGGDSLTDDQKKVLDYIHTHAGNLAIPVATEGGAMGASSLIIHSDLTIVGMGGFSGGDAAPTAEQLGQWQQRGELGFVLVGGGPGGFGGPPGQPQGADATGQRGGDGNGQRGGPGRGAASSARSEWMQKSCTLVNPSTYGGSADDGSQQLYDCRRR